MEGVRPRPLRLRRLAVPVRAAGGGDRRGHRRRLRCPLVRPRPRARGRLPRRRDLAERPGPGRGHPGRRTPPLGRHRGAGGRPPGPDPARHHRGAGQCRTRPARPRPRPRPGERRRLHPRRSRRQQRVRHDRGDHEELLPHALLPHLRTARRHRRGHRRSAGGRGAGARGAGAVPRAAGDQAGDRGRPGARRPDPGQVRDQEHHRLPSRRVPGRLHARRDPARADGRLGGHAGLHRRGRLRHRGAGPRAHQRPALLPPVSYTHL